MNGIRFVAKEVKIAAVDMKNISFQLRKEQNLALVLASKIDEKALLSVMLTDDLVEKGLNAVEIIKVIAKEINGGGGGQAFFATAGGVDTRGIKTALDKVKRNNCIK